jgi:uncharacterized protein YndB with AHSA1/START domain
MTTEDLKPVFHSIAIDATPEEIFPYFVEAELIVQWIANSAELDPRPGGVFRLDFDTLSQTGEYLEVDPPHRVVFTWGVIGDEAFAPGSSTVEVVLRPEGTQTVVELTHGGLAGDWVAAHDRGWPVYLGVLSEIAAQH